MRLHLLLLLLFSIILTTTIRAQDFGVRVGANISNFVGEHVSNSNFKIGPHAGIYLQADIGGDFYFQPEVLFSVKGSRYSETFDNGKFVWKTHLYSIDIPLLAEYEIGFDHFVQLGLQPSIQLFSKFVTVHEGERTVDNPVQEFKDLDFGIVAGYEYTTDFDLNIGLRFVYGLPKAVKNVPFNEDNVHVFNMMITFGYTFD